VEILEYVDRCKESSMEQKSKLEEERERFQQAACRVLDMLGPAASNPLSVSVVVHFMLIMLIKSRPISHRSFLYSINGGL
jgi:hypothetical protein